MYFFIASPVYLNLCAEWISKETKLFQTETDEGLCITACLKEKIVLWAVGQCSECLCVFLHIFSELSQLAVMLASGHR